MAALKLLGETRIVPVVVLANAGVAAPLAETLLGAGVKIIEVTLRTSDALDGISEIAKIFPEMLIGAGSVRRPDQLAAARDAGAAFAVSPGSTELLIDTANALQLPYIPGAATASEMLALHEKGYRLQKFFPAELAGGHAYLKAVGAPLPEIGFMPTGGITTDNARDYLKLKNVRCIGGSWIAPPALQRAADFAAIGKLAKDAARLGV